MDKDPDLDGLRGDESIPQARRSESGRPPDVRSIRAPGYTFDMTPSALTRRGFLAAAGSALLLPSAVLAAAAESVSKDKRRMLQVNGYAIDAETPLDALTTYLTPNDLFFVRHHWNPDVSGRCGAGRSTVDGEVVDASAS